MTRFNNNKKADICSSEIGALTLALDGDGYIQGTDVECRWALVKVEAATAINGVATVAATDYPLAATDAAILIQVDNLSLLHFKGTATKKVYILYGG